jgi:hypothetical protein
LAVLIVSRASPDVKIRKIIMAIDGSPRRQEVVGRLWEISNRGDVGGLPQGIQRSNRNSWSLMYYYFYHCRQFPKLRTSKMLKFNMIELAKPREDWEELRTGDRQRCCNSIIERQTSTSQIEWKKLSK